MPFAKGGYEILAVQDDEEVLCDGCGMVMHGLGHPMDTAREGKADVYWYSKKRDVCYCEECYWKATGELPLDDVGPQEVDS